MRRKVYSITIALCAVIGIGLYGFAVFRHEVEWAILATLALVVALLVYLAGGLQRLLSDWPPGIIFGHGFESGFKAAGGKYKKRRALDIVRPDDEG